MSNQQSFKLISFNICPFVQRSRILLNAKQVDYEIEYIDLANKPDWFLKRSPTGKVPALFIGDETLFESAVINEYLDEVTPGSLMPDLPLERAKNRAWISLTDTLIFSQYHLMTATNAAAFEAKRAELRDGLLKFSEVADKRAEAADISLLDAAIAPVFTRVAETPALGAYLRDTLTGMPGVLRWGERLLAAPSVSNSMADGFSEQFHAYFNARDSYVLAA